MENLNDLIANNLSRIRKEKNLSLDQLSNLCGVSKSMLSQIEKGKKTPTITTLWKIAGGLNISLSLLIDEQKSSVRIVSSKDSIPLMENEGKYKAYPFLPFDQEANFEVFKMDVEPDCIHVSNPHTAGVREYVFVSSGTLKVRIKNSLYTVEEGEAIIFEGDVMHEYINDTKNPVSSFVVILYPKYGV